MSCIKRLKKRLINNAISLEKNNDNISGEKRTSAFIFDDLYMNFNQKSFKEIQKVKKWKNRLEKKHTYFNGNIFEMQSSNSSDALLMNIFCYPKIKRWKSVQNLLEVDFDNDIIFGWDPGFNNEDDNHPTEVDLRIGNLIFEAKLTEKNFTSKDIKTVKQYESYTLVFDQDYLNINSGKVENYQLIRNILAAYKHEYKFNLLVDETRTDLIRELFNTVKAVKVKSLRKRIGFITWQELVYSCGKELKEYIKIKYF